MNNVLPTMKSSKKIISLGGRKAHPKKFSKHWLDAVRLSDVTVLADSGSNDNGGNGGNNGGEIYYQVGGYSPIHGVGAYVSPWNTSNPSSNPAVYNYSESFIVLVAGGHFGILSIENLGGGNWRTVAGLDGVTLISSPYSYTGSNHTYLEIDLDSSGNWRFWADFGSVGGNHGSISPYGQTYVQFGCGAGSGDYLMYNAFSNCGVNFASSGWTAPNFSGLAYIGNPQFKTTGATVDSVLFEDDPPY